MFEQEDSNSCCSKLNGLLHVNFKKQDYFSGVTIFS